jgi:D-alanine-D-alanine ligase-like ATP-grasp enzyme
VLSVVRREPASIVGDGRHTVEELVIAANVVRRGNPSLGRLPIPLDGRADGPLHGQGLTRTSIPPAGQRVRLRTVANLSQGGESHEVMDTTHHSVLALAVTAVRAVPGLPYAGLDILMEDHRLPVDAQQVTIIEVNSVPMLTMHHYPMFGPPRPVAAELVGDLVGSGTVEHGGGLRARPRWRSPRRSSTTKCREDTTHRATRMAKPLC